MARIKNGFKFYAVDKYAQNDFYCLSYHELPHEQTTVEFSGSWYDASGKHYDKFHADFWIYVENSSSKWISIDSANYYYRDTVGSHTLGNILGPYSTQDDYYELIQFINPHDAIDLSKLTLTSPDRLDAKGTYYINWQTYEFQNNGEQLIKDAIKPENNAKEKDFIMQTYRLILRALRELGIEEWLPGDTKKLNIEDRKSTRLNSSH